MYGLTSVQEAFGVHLQTLDTNLLGTKFYAHLPLDIKIRRFRYFIYLAQSVSTVKSHLIFYDIQTALNLSLHSY